MAETLDGALHGEAVARAERLLAIACARKFTIATAESCTGGLLAALLTDVPGCSHAFERGFVVYSDEAKCDLLSIRPERIASCGAVSREIAMEMALGALAASTADLAVAITGFAGPAGPENEEGLVHIASVRRHFPVRHREMHFGPVGRAAVRRGALDVALELLEADLQP